MQIITQGYGMQGASWHVSESRSAGYCRIYYITAGRVFYKDARHSMKLMPGRLYVFPSHSPYEISHDPADPLCCLWHHIDFFPVMNEELIELQPDGPLQSLLDALIGCIASERTDTAFRRSMSEALGGYLLECGRMTEPDPTLTAMLAAIRACCAAGSFCVADAASLLGYSTEHFIRLFRSRMHTTPYQYASDLRMLEAAQLLTAGRTVNEVAEKLGFAESKTFARAFTQKYGLSPARYRRLLPSA